MRRGINWDSSRRLLAFAACRVRGRKHRACLMYGVLFGPRGVVRYRRSRYGALQCGRVERTSQTLHRTVQSARRSNQSVARWSTDVVCYHHFNVISDILYCIAYQASVQHDSLCYDHSRRQWHCRRTEPSGRLVRQVFLAQKNGKVVFISQIRYSNVAFIFITIVKVNRGKCQGGNSGEVTKMC